MALISLLQTSKALLEMGEEFQEADVLWPDHSPVITTFEPSERSQSISARRKGSVPIDIPRKTIGLSRSWTMGSTYRDNENRVADDEGDGNDGGSGEITPPHILAARRMTDKVACSVCTGSGRTLKGRDLCQVRNSVLRMTGFLER